MTNWDERDLIIDFSFLNEGETYRCTLIKDGINASKQAEDYVCEKITVTRNTRLKLHLASGGGFALKLERTFLSDIHPSGIPE